MLLEDWTIIENAGTTIKIEAELEDHKNIIELDDTSSDNEAIIRQNFPENQSAGTIEFWSRFSPVSTASDGIQYHFIIRSQTSSTERFFCFVCCCYLGFTQCIIICVNR